MRVRDSLLRRITRGARTVGDIHLAEPRPLQQVRVGVWAKVRARVRLRLRLRGRVRAGAAAPCGGACGAPRRAP